MCRPCQQARHAKMYPQERLIRVNAEARLIDQHYWLGTHRNNKPAGEDMIQPAHGLCRPVTLATSYHSGCRSDPQNGISIRGLVWPHPQRMNLPCHPNKPIQRHSRYTPHPKQESTKPTSVDTSSLKKTGNMRHIIAHLAYICVGHENPAVRTPNQDLNIKTYARENVEANSCLT